MPCPACNSETEASKNYSGDACGLLMSAYILAGLAMMLNIRLSYSSAPFALIRFRLPENLFSVFVRRMASALELWCLPSMLLGNIMDLIQKLFDGGAELRAIKVKATKLQKAGELKSAPGLSGAGEASAAAGTLEGKAGTLNSEASQIKGGDLDVLKTDAIALASAAGSSGLQQKASELASQSTDTGKAIAVIEAFGKVKAAYLALSKQEKYIENRPPQGSSPEPSTPQGRVKAVEDAWGNVKGDFGTLCKALIKQYATEVETKATELQRDPSVDNAKLFKDKYDNFGKVYDAIPADQPAKTAVTSDWNNLKGVIVGEMKRWKFYWIIIPSIITQWLNFLTYVILLIIFFTVVKGLEKIPSQMQTDVPRGYIKLIIPVQQLKYNKLYP
uniref:Tpr-related protein family member, putative n=1 Tax=Theileria annulata TaxID=5874 RepID=A0A3B0ML40_THEAN